MRNLQKYGMVFRLSCLLTLKNYKALIGMSIFLVSCLVIFSFLWKVAAAKVGAIDFSSDQLLWYIAFNEWVLLSLPDTHNEIEEDLHTGRLAYLLSRPISYLGSIFAGAFGVLSINLLVLGGVTLLFTSSQVGLLSVHPLSFFAFLLFGFLGGILGIIFQMLIGLSAFWVQDVEPFLWIWERLLFIFGGIILPLIVFPEWMQVMAYLTPFPAILGERSALFMHFTWEHILVFLGMWMFWCIFGCLCLIFFYRRGLKILNIQGG
ncbi:MULTISPECIES: hypothetical protein [Parachlamydia]|jgi:ABC-2 type transport system permease protein|uniref:ABC transporter permease n=1 Tax=Parachlamydia acanthamoebae (strain UV7) TaxID=765952 RepID=F8KXG8_PARAV|nr:hypothetical protein [Parachlamydia acanthamoebae]EFB40645.1 hypothetical protein pah_c197o020 [Parachlamydia acanthamoebae str. Hall's coccus]CCB87027.1 putative uncharacterized protein [Parachlamydia acanthamoebae UV-7]